MLLCFFFHGVFSNNFLIQFLGFSCTSSVSCKADNHDVHKHSNGWVSSYFLTSDSRYSASHLLKRKGNPPESTVFIYAWIQFTSLSLNVAVAALGVDFIMSYVIINLWYID